MDWLRRRSVEDRHKVVGLHHAVGHLAVSKGHSTGGDDRGHLVGCAETLDERREVRIGGGDKTHVVTTLAEAQEQVRLLIQPLLPPPEEPAPPESDSAVMEESLR